MKRYRNSKTNAAFALFLRGLSVPVEPTSRMGELCARENVKVVDSNVEEAHGANSDDRRAYIAVRDDLDAEHVCNGPPADNEGNLRTLKRRGYSADYSYRRSVR